MSEVLYRKYRSQTFDELIGQAHITDILKKAVITGSISHAFLFVGSRGTGKTSTARILAKAINCKKLTEEGNPCNECESCKSITNGTFLDLIEIDAASNRGIDQIRELKERIEFSPVEGKYKIYIIDEVHMLTTEAFNALLKTLEEPPPHVVFMLATTDVHKLPATILSRCQRYDFHLGTDEKISYVVKLSAEREGVTLSEGALNLITQNARGSYRDALSLLDVVVSGQLESDKPDEVSENEVRTILGIPDSTMVYYLLEKIVKAEGSEALDLVKELDVKGVNFEQFIKLILETLRTILVNKIQGKKETEYTFAEELSHSDIIKLISLFIDAERQLRNTAIPALVLEMVIAQTLLMYGDLASDHKVVKRASSKNTKNDNNGGGGDKEVSLDSGSNEKDTGVSKSKSTKKDQKVTNNDATLQKVNDESSEKTDSVVITKNESDEVPETGVSEKMDNLAASEEVSTQEVVKEDDVERTKQTSDTGQVDLDIEKIEDRWSDVIKGIQKFNGHLYAFLKAAKVSEVENGYLILEVPFNFHKERIESPKSREAINDVLVDVLGAPLAIRCMVNETIKRKKSSSADVILSKIQNTQEKVAESQKTEPAVTPEKKSPPKPRKVSKKVEAIFADL